MIADGLRVGDHRRIFGDRGDDRLDVELLVAHLAQRQPGVADRRLVLHLPRDHQHGNRIDERAINSCDRIGPARPRRDVDQGHALGQPGISLGGHRERLLMMAKNGLDLGMRADRVVEVHRAPAGQHECVADAVRDQLVGNPMR